MFVAADYIGPSLPAFRKCTEGSVPVCTFSRSKLDGPEELLLLVGRPYRIRIMQGLGLLAQLFLVILAIGMQRLEGQHCYKHDY